jgi:hypothetical protein
MTCGPTADNLCGRTTPGAVLPATPFLRAQGRGWRAQAGRGAASPQEAVRAALAELKARPCRAPRPEYAHALTYTYDACGVFGATLQEKIDVFQSNSLKLVAETPNALRSSQRPKNAPR